MGLFKSQGDSGAPHLELHGKVPAHSKSGRVPQARKNGSQGSCDFLHTSDSQKGQSAEMQYIDGIGCKISLEICTNKIE